MRDDLSLHVHVRVGKVEHDYAAIVDAVCRVRAGETVVVCAATFALMSDVVEYLESHRQTRDRMLDFKSVVSFHGMVDRQEKDRVFSAGDDMRLLITNGAFSHGVNIKGLTIFVVGAFDSKAMMLQALGRASRGGEGAIVHLVVRDLDFKRREKALLAEAESIRTAAVGPLLEARALRCEEASRALAAFRANIGIALVTFVLLFRSSLAHARPAHSEGSRQRSHLPHRSVV